MSQQPPRKIVNLDYSAPGADGVGASDRIPPFVWISAGLVIVPTIVLTIYSAIVFATTPAPVNALSLLCNLPLLVMIVALSGDPTRGQQIEGQVDHAMAIVLLFICAILLLAEFASLRYRFQLAAGLIVIFLGLCVSALILLVLHPPPPITDLLYPLCLIAVGLFAMTGHILWFVRILRR
jgi:hypothetical protein